MLVQGGVEIDSRSFRESCPFMDGIGKPTCCVVLMQGMSDILEDEIKLSNDNATVNVTVTGLACDRSGNSCSAVGEDGFSAQLELYCGNAKYPSSSFLISGAKLSESFLKLIT